VQPTPDSVAILLPPVLRGYVGVLASGMVYDVPVESLAEARKAEPMLVVLSVSPQG
jgi:hypothetical protein